MCVLYKYILYFNRVLHHNGKRTNKLHYFIHIASKQQVLSLRRFSFDEFCSEHSDKSQIQTLPNCRFFYSSMAFHILVPTLLVLEYYRYFLNGRRAHPVVPQRLPNQTKPPNLNITKPLIIEPLHSPLLNSLQEIISWVNYYYYSNYLFIFID